LPKGNQGWPSGLRCAGNHRETRGTQKVGTRKQKRLVGEKGKKKMTDASPKWDEVPTRPIGARYRKGRISKDRRHGGKKGIKKMVQHHGSGTSGARVIAKSRGGEGRGQGVCAKESHKGNAGGGKLVELGTKHGKDQD